MEVAEETCVTRDGRRDVEQEKGGYRVDNGSEEGERVEGSSVFRAESDKGLWDQGCVNMAVHRDRQGIEGEEGPSVCMVGDGKGPEIGSQEEGGVNRDGKGAEGEIMEGTS
ncbi:hypothetical protein FKM82_026253, partial [Ascaphus truei]